jgi:cobaltochelatase CobT
MSYVRSDDEHEWGRITKFRERLEGEVRIQTGRPFAIFQDRNDIQWGQQWAQMIAQSLADVKFLIPIITPSFFESPACRDEFNAFLLREQTLGLDRLILPVLYLDCDQLQPDAKTDDPIAKVLMERNWTDWRSLRFKAANDEAVLGALATLAKMIKATMRELDAIIAKSTSIEPKGREILEIDITTTGLIEATPTDTTYVLPEARPGPIFDRQVFDEVRKNPYYAYSRRFDETINASELAEPGELMKLFRFVSKAAARSEDYYDSLTRQLSNRIKRLPEAPSISITCLLDNSGSMRGRKIIDLAGAMTILIDWLERWQIRSEILGFTTRAWKGGQAREMWLSDRKPARPGRLNHLRHIIYKSFGAPSHTSAPSLGVMAREGLLKENIDGEALLWAYGRLVRETSAQKLLVIFTDGSPVDDSTLSVNNKTFLESHLSSVIHHILTEKLVSLRAVGIECDVSKYFAEPATVMETNQLAAPVFNILGSIIK